MQIAISGDLTGFSFNTESSTLNRDAYRCQYRSSSTSFTFVPMSACILGCQYIPSAEYFAHWLYHGSVSIEACEHYQKRTWRNKALILGPDEPLTLTIPLQKGKHQQRNIREVKIAYDELWTLQHINSLQAAYGKTAFAEEVLTEIFDLLKANPVHLWEFNLKVMEHIIELLKGVWEYKFTEDFILHYDDDIVDLRKGIPFSTPFGHQSTLTTYAQVHRLGKTFQPNLTILDVLCHLGPGASEYLSRYASQLYPTS